MQFVVIDTDTIYLILNSHVYFEFILWFPFFSLSIRFIFLLPNLQYYHVLLPRSYELVISRTSRPEVFCKKGVLRNLQNSQVFSSEFCEISKNSFYYRTPPVAASAFRVLLFLLLRECSFPAVALKETLNLAFYLSNHPFEAWNFSTWSSCAKLIAFSLRIVPLISKLFIRTLLNQSK